MLSVNKSVLLNCFDPLYSAVGCCHHLWSAIQSTHAHKYTHSSWATVQSCCQHYSIKIVRPVVYVGFLWKIIVPFKWFWGTILRHVCANMERLFSSSHQNIFNWLRVYWGENVFTEWWTVCPKTHKMKTFIKIKHLCIYQVYSHKQITQVKTKALKSKTFWETNLA